MKNDPKARARRANLLEDRQNRGLSPDAIRAMREKAIKDARAKRDAPTTTH